jgi:8-oxo-dGTP diphosphatase
VGGKLLPGETPLAACLREVREETGYVIDDARFAGALTWAGFENLGEGGLYLFTALAPKGDPIPSVEGELRWWPREWACSSPHVVSNLPYVLPAVLDNAPPQVYHFEYRAGAIVHHQVRPWP